MNTCKIMEAVLKDIVMSNPAKYASFEDANKHVRNLARKALR
jgi:hypothetical protein